MVGWHLALRLFGHACPTFFDLDYRLVGRLHRFTGKEPGKAFTAGNGFRMAGNTYNASYFAGISERRFLHATAALIDAGNVVYNIGANIGYTALWLAHQCRGKIGVFAFEPEPETFECLQENIALNSLPIFADRLAMSDAEGSAELSSTGVGDGAAAIGRKVANASVYCVRTTTIDSYIVDHPKPDCLVIDVEGHAGHVLRGAVKTLEEKRPTLAIEVHSEAESRLIDEVVRPFHYRLRKELKGLWGRHIILCKH